MRRHRKKHLQRVTGAPPPRVEPVAATGTAGAQAAAGGVEIPEISIFAYTDETLVEKKGVSLEEVAQFRDHPGIVWINVNGLAAPHAVERICDLYRIHPLIVEDILTPSQRPKFEDFDAYISVVVKMFYLSDDENEAVTEQVSLVLGKGYVLSFQEKPAKDVFEPIRNALRTKKGKVRRLGADYLAYSLIDAVVDGYYVILEKLNERIEELEDEAIDAPTHHTLQRMHELRNEIIFLRKSVWPLREVIDRLEHNAEELIQPNTILYLRDVYDHTVQIMEQIEVLRDIVTGMLEMYLSSVSYKLNEVLKRLTVITTIFMPLSVLASIGGMSEWSMMTGPDNWPLSYALFVMGLAVIGVLTYLVFKLKKWA